jgi:hypothetical protein
MIFDGRFSDSDGTVAKSRMGGFSAAYDCASRDGCRWFEAIPREHANKQVLKTREIRGQRGTWSCFCGRQDASDSVSRPWLPTEWLSRAVSAWSCRSSKKRASLSSQPRAPSSRPEIGMVSMLRACDKKPRTLVAQTVVGVPE